MTFKRCCQHEKWKVKVPVSNTSGTLHASRLRPTLFFPKLYRLLLLLFWQFENFEKKMGLCQVVCQWCWWLLNAAANTKSERLKCQSPTPVARCTHLASGPPFFSPNFTDYCYYCFWQFENFEKKMGLCQVVCQWCWWLLNAAANTKSERLKCQSPTPVARCTHLASGPPFFSPNFTDYCQKQFLTIWKLWKKDGAVSSCVSVVLMTFKCCCQHEKWKVKVPVSNTSGTLHASRLRPTLFSPNFTNYCQLLFLTIWKLWKKDGAVSSCVSVVLMTFKCCCQHEKWKVKVPVSNTSGTLHASRLRPTLFPQTLQITVNYCFWQFENFEKKMGLCQVVCQWCWWLLNAAANTKSERLKCQSPTPVARCTHLASGPPFFPKVFRLLSKTVNNSNL